MSAAARPQPTPLAFEPEPGLTLAAESAGDGAPLVLAHGLTATRRNVLQGSRHLLGRGRRLVSYDARGHGESAAPADRGAYEYADLELDLAGLLDRLELDRVALAGSSMGAATVLRLALSAPERVTAVVAITPAYTDAARLDPAALAHWDRLAAALDAGDLDAFVAESGADDLPERWRAPARLATRQRLERHRDLGAVADALRVVPRSEALAGLDALAALEAPVLVVGSRDEADPGHPLEVAREYADRLPKGELVSEQEDEVPLAWQGARLSRAIGDFLERVGA